ncbi:MAG: hypothetical protein ACYC63_20910 [Armatimonadota bacterium]
MRAVYFLLISILILLPLAATAQDKPVLTVNVHGDEVDYDEEVGTIVVHGNVTVTASTDKPGMPTVSLAAEQLQGNLRTGRLTASERVRLISQQVAMTGQNIELDFKNDNFTVDRGGMSVDVPSPGSPGRILRGFFFGDKIGFENRIIYVIEGRITTCDRLDPHYYIGSQETTYDTANRVLTIEGGTLKFYGLKLRIPARFTKRFGDRSGEPGLRLPLPGYSSFDGLYADYRRNFTGASRPWQMSGTVRIGTELQFPAMFLVERADEDSEFTATVSRREQVVWDLRERSRISRLPELWYVKHLRPELGGLPRLDVGAFAGYISERPEEDFPEVEATRAGVWFDYTPRPWARQNRRGLWWAATGRQTFYDTGDSLSDLAVELGTGWRWSDNFAASLSARHHFTSGESPFFFDDIWVEDELIGTLQAPLARDWQFHATARYDLDESSLRDYSLGLSRRMHCLTWKLTYDFGAEMVAVGLDLNGVTGDTAPPVTAPLVAPAQMPPLPPMIPGDAGEDFPFQILQ